MMTAMDDKLHVLVIPYPAQGHVMPLMKLSYCLADRGFIVTFVNAESIHARLTESTAEGKGIVPDGMRLVSISDGLSHEEQKLVTAIDNAVRNVLPIEFEKLVMNSHVKFSCVIADESVGWALDIARKNGIRGVPFCPAAAGIKALARHIPKLIEMKLVDENRTPKSDELIIWSPTMPGIKPDELMWRCMGGLVSSEAIFHSMLKTNEASNSTKWILCNTSDDIENMAIAVVPNLLPIGPLLARNELGSFWPEDSSCLSWLDQQPSNSVIYIAFGSIAIFNQLQFSELAFGLELLGMAFLWVVKPDLYGRPATTFPDGFEDRVGSHGKIVSWAPQGSVLSHPSIACFVSHCGWNSVIDGVCAGVPFLCWPYFADQFFNQTYITEAWKVGLGLDGNEEGTISRHEFKKKVNELLDDKVIKENAQKLKDLSMKSVAKGGSSSRNLELFIEELRR